MVRLELWAKVENESKLSFGFKSGTITKLGRLGEEPMMGEYSNTLCVDLIVPLDQENQHKSDLSKTIISFAALYSLRLTYQIAYKAGGKLSQSPAAVLHSSMVEISLKF